METATAFVFFIHLTAAIFHNTENVSLVSANDPHKGRDSGKFDSDYWRQLTVLDKYTMHISSFPYTFGKDSRCGLHFDIVRHEATTLNVGALKMLDASAKLPSGVLSGNLNQFGDFDECLSSGVKLQNEYIRGKYCLATVDINFKNPGRSENISAIDDLIHSHRLVSNQLGAAGHRIPRLETFIWGMCMPHSCTSKDISDGLQQHLDELTNPDQIRMNVLIDEKMCFEEGNRNKEFKATNLLAVLFFVILISLVLIATALDVYDLKVGSIKSYIVCFSLKRNFSDLVATGHSKDDIRVLHGLRFANAIALLLSHKQMAMLFNPYINRTQMSEILNKPWTMIGRSAILYTDSFIWLSGLLLSYSFVKELDEKGKLNLKQRFISRLIRLLPNLFSLIVFCTFIMEYTGTGPQWGLVVKQYADLCKLHMWRNFLFIHNYFGFENMCLTHTHQLGIDMQLFVVSPIVVYILWKSTRRGLLLLLALTAASTCLRYYVTLKEGLSTIIYFGISVEQLWKTASLSYILPTHRLSVYVVGMAVGYFLRRNGKRLSFPRYAIWLGWTSALLLATLAMFGPHRTSSKNYLYSAQDAAYYNAFLPLFWVVFLSWCVIACENGWGGWFDHILSWKYFPVFSRISYALYLVQFPVFFYNVGTQRVAKFYNGVHTMVDIQEFVAIFALSVIMTLFIELPFQKLRKQCSRNRTSKGTAQSTQRHLTADTVHSSTGKNYKRRRLENHAD